MRFQLTDILILPPRTPLPFVSLHFSQSFTRSPLQQVLLAVIFSCDSAPDSRMGREFKRSQNISARFSRISVIFDAKNPLGETVSDGEVAA